MQLARRAAPDSSLDVRDVATARRRARCAPASRAGRRAGAGRRACLSVRRHQSRGPHRPAAGRRAPCSAPPAAPIRSATRDQHGREPGLALYRFSGSRPARHEPHGQRHLGHGLRHRGRAAEEAHEAADRHAHAAAYYLLSFLLSRLLDAGGSKSGRCWAFALLVFGVPVRGSLLALALICVLTSLAFGALGLLIASRCAPSKPRPVS